MKSITDKQIKQWDFISKTLLKDNRSQHRLRDIGNKMFLSYNILDSDADVANNLSKPLTELDPVFLFRFLSSCVIDEELTEHSERLIKDLFKETEIKKYKNDKVMNVKLDGSDLINMLISRLNETSYCATYGQINNVGKYNKTYMYSALERTYKKMKERSEVGDAAKELAEVINEYDDNMKLKNYSLLDLYIMCRASKDKKKIDYKKIKKEHNSALFNSKRANITSDMINITDNYLI